MSTYGAADPALAEALSAFDAMLRREILRLQSRYQLSLDEFRGLYVSDEQVDELIRREGIGEDADALDIEAGTVARRALFDAVRRHSRLSQLGERLGLTELDTVLALIAAAPGLDPRYETVFAYLNDDVSRKTLSVDLAIRLLSANPVETLAVRAALAPDGQLVRGGLVSLHGSRDASYSTGPRTLVAVHTGLADFIAGLPFVDDKLTNAVCVHTPSSVQKLVAPVHAIREIGNRIRQATSAERPRLPVLGPSPSLNITDFCQALCVGWDQSLMTLDVRLLARDFLFEAMGRAGLLAQLAGAVLLVEGLEVLEAGGRFGAEAHCLRTFLRFRRVPVLIGLPSAKMSGLPFAPTEIIEISVPVLPGDVRRRLWVEALTTVRLRAESTDVDSVSSTFLLGPEAITAAANALADEAAARPSYTVPPAQLLAAARAQSDSGLGQTASRMPQRHTWHDLVLPPATKDRLRMLINALRSRRRVLDEWGLLRVIGAAGIRTLFAGPSGTGKTMTAAIIARELGLDAYRIDLSQTVSKYIGETEKNLERIFQAAETAQAVLFFDEADALLGKRAEVKDAHDRYANIEVAYLLQRLEEFTGIVILATNISENVDLAFARRMQFVIEFPMPGPLERAQLWRLMLPPSVPTAGDIDYELLGRRFDLAGGDIRNVVLDAAFAAAGRSEPVGMRHIAPALARELVKQGRSPSAADFRHHFALLEAVDRAG